MDTYIGIYIGRSSIGGEGSDIILAVVIINISGH